jgi:hypothetical protein
MPDLTCVYQAATANNTEIAQCVQSVSEPPGQSIKILINIIYQHVKHAFLSYHSAPPVSLCMLETKPWKTADKVIDSILHVISA